jgi:citrate synthase
MTIRASGLEDFVFATTRLSDVDGAAGHLSIAGHAVEALSGVYPIEHVAWLLFYGAAPTADDLARTRRALGQARLRAHARLPSLGDALDAPDAMDALRAALAHTSPSTSARAPGVDAAFARCLELAGALATFAGAWAAKRTRPGEAPASPHPEAPHAADFLRLVTGAPTADARRQALDAYLVAVVDHGMNASTFAARVVASTASDDGSAVGAALGALKGRLHGGAPGPVLDMLDAVLADGDAARWVAATLARGERIMGMGHRVYRVRDPRADVLERAVRRLEAGADASGVGARLSLARDVEAAAEAALAKRHPDRPLRANVEFYTAILLEALGIPRDLFTATFAASRVFGWCAHVYEQRHAGKLIRLQSRFVSCEPFGSPAVIA